MGVTGGRVCISKSPGGVEVSLEKSRGRTGLVPRFNMAQAFFTWRFASRHDGALEMNQALSI